MKRMTNSDREQELLQKYMDHLLPEDDGRLKRIKQRVGSDLFRKRQKAALKKRANRFYAASIACMLLCVGIFGGYRFLLHKELSRQHAISNVFKPYPLNNIQDPRLLTALCIILAALFISGLICLWRGIQNQKKSEKI